jgi:hypothetical protein
MLPERAFLWQRRMIKGFAHGPASAAAYAAIHLIVFREHAGHFLTSPAALYA